MKNTEQQLSSLNRVFLDRFYKASFAQTPCLYDTLDESMKYSVGKPKVSKKRIPFIQRS